MHISQGDVLLQSKVKKIAKVDESDHLASNVIGAGWSTNDELISHILRLK